MARFVFSEMDKKIAWLLLKRLAVLYVCFVSLLILAKHTIPIFSRFPLGEAIYGPAVMLACCYALVLLAMVLSSLRKRKDNDPEG